ncbi:MAG TPA: sugar transferase [Candidatus Binatia bacterium]|nr:sugar transferase [Candidatus Binatia bacterium]
MSDTIPPIHVPLRRSALVAALKVADLALVTASWAIATAIGRAGLSLERWPSLVGVLRSEMAVADALAVAAYLYFFHLVLSACGIYRSHRIAPASRERGELATAVVLASFPLVVVGWWLEPALLPPHFLVAFPIAALASLLLAHEAFRCAARLARSAGRNLRDVVIVADGPSSLGVAMKLASRVGLGYRVVRVIPCGSEPPGAGAPRPPAEVARELEELLAERPVDELFLALQYGSAQPLARALLLRCEQQGITVRVIANLTALDCAWTTVDALGGHPVITVATGPRDAVQLALKRAVDVAGALVGLVALAPLMASIALAIKLDSRGPVIFAQQRVGLNRRRFRALKFRTMVNGADRLQKHLEHRNEADGPVFKIENDPRVTRVGRILRKLSLDELPQLVNVLRGEMSLVGPRPLPVRDVTRFDANWHKRRFSVKPGITCIWQATRREPTFDEWVRSDMEYIDNWSIGLDLKILAKTFSMVLSRDGVH